MKNKLKRPIINKNNIYFKLKKFLLAFFSCNLIFFNNPLLAHKNANGLDRSFFIGQMIVYCILEDDGVISERDARKYIGMTKRWMIENEDVDIDIKIILKTTALLE